MATLMLLIAVLLRLFLVPHPEEVGYLVDDAQVSNKITKQLEGMISKT